MRIRKTSELEKKKLELEIGLLEKPWFKDYHYLQIIIPLFLGIASLLYAFYSGLIDKQRMDLEITKKQLQYDIQKFNDKKDSLNTLNYQLEQNADLLKFENINLKIHTNSLKDSIMLNFYKLESINEQLKKKSESEYVLGCDLQINNIEQNLQSINGTLWFEGTNRYLKMRKEYWNSQEFKDYQIEIQNRSDLTTIQKIETPLNKDYALTQHYKVNRKIFVNYLLHLRDSLFIKSVSTKLNKCNESFTIGSQIPKKPYINFFTFNSKNKEDEPFTLIDSLNLYIRRK